MTRSATSAGAAWLSTAAICARYGITPTTWGRTWDAYPELLASVRRFRSSPGARGQRRWPADVVARWWERSSK